MKQFQELFDNLHGKTTVQKLKQVEKLVGESVLIDGYVRDIKADVVELAESEWAGSAYALVRYDFKPFGMRMSSYSVGDEVQVTARVTHVDLVAGCPHFEFELRDISRRTTPSERQKMRSEDERAERRKGRPIAGAFGGLCLGGILGGLTGCYSCVRNAPVLDTLWTPLNMINGSLYGAVFGLVAGLVLGFIANQLSN